VLNYSRFQVRRFTSRPFVSSNVGLVGKRPPSVRERARIPRRVQSGDGNSEPTDFVNKLAVSRLARNSLRMSPCWKIDIAPLKK
jgi:hypothetical protein